MAHLTVILGIDEAEAVKQLEGGHGVNVCGGNRHICVVAGTNNENVHEWRYWIYTGRIGDLQQVLLDTVIGSAMVALSTAIGIAEEPSYEFEARMERVKGQTT